MTNRVKQEARAILAFSINDILTLPPFKGMTKFDLLKPENDAAVKETLFEVGVDDNAEMSIQACQHKDYSGNLVIDYRYCFHERIDKSWLNSGFASMGALVASQRDRALAADMINASREGIGASGFAAMCVDATGKDGPTSRSGKDIISSKKEQVKVVGTIKELQEVQRQIRGVLEFNDNIFNKGTN